MSATPKRPNTGRLAASRPAANRHVAVIDIGKTNAKLALVDLSTLTEIAVMTRPNPVLPGPPYPHYDVEGHWAFLLGALASMQRDHGIDAISVTTHGASAALIDAEGGLAAPVLDYEHDGPDAMTGTYDALRPGFGATGSPRLPRGLNLGAQIHWLMARDPGLAARTARIVTYPQYWGFRLTGVAASDVTSLGCHTDLWLPREGRVSELPARLGIADKLAPPRRPSEVLGPLRSDVAARTGLAPGTPVHCGIHDSNASLLPYLQDHAAPFAVVSTGTWVVAMAVGGAPVTLDEGRDTLINVNGLGAPVPSARFMGGREYEMLGAPDGATPAGIAGALAREAMLLPAVVPESGPFPGRRMRWSVPEAGLDPATRAAAVAFYLALMTAECLGLAGAAGPVIVEGPFAANLPYLRMLGAATGRPILRSASRTGTSAGAALLAARPGDATARPDLRPVGDTDDPALRSYARRWRQAL
ncbi:FGGY-family carbohydrate kinase [Acidimangrovimonas sediminis]|uniref:FGGY-family carbohydrate kinase n=1 Tax=Acidimangrovimonas sediminis TaxID=2056283 RepID=UPI000C804216|nr:FGGY-family carbohydrate kinase [Acidimangrovimonas sediminis]